MNIESARRIGLLETETPHIHPAGNTSLRGLKMALLAPSQREAWIAGLRARVEHVPLAADPAFQETFVECLPFPGEPASAPGAGITSRESEVGSKG